MNIEIQLADLIIKINNYPFQKIPEKMQPFVYEKNMETYDFLYNVHSYDGIMEKQGQLIFRNNIREVYKLEKKYMVYFCYKLKADSNFCLYSIFDMNHRCADVYVSNDFYRLAYGEELFMTSLDIDFILLWFQRIIMHASVVKYEDQAVLFSGPSGIGKSTQAELWKKYMNADILNGDRATLDVAREKVYVYGSPYAGSSHIYRNECAPVKAVVLLGQGEENSIGKLSGMKAYKEMFPRFSIARWDDKLFHESMDIISNVIEKTPIYKLICTPDERAVQLVYDTLYK